MTRSERAPGIWLFGPASDMLWGAGLAYVFVFSILMVSGGLVMSVLPAWLMMFLVVLVSVPHYGATLLRAYEKEEDRRLYRLFSIYTTGALVLFSFLYMNGPSSYSPFRGTHVQFVSLDLPAFPADVVMFASLLLYGVTTFVVVAALAGKGLRSSAPALGVVLTQFVWFVLPSVVKNWLPYGGPPILGAGYDQYAFTRIALGHAVQYLWIAAYFARATGRVSSTVSFYGRAVVCGCALWALPLFLFAPGLLGRLPFDGGLASVTAAVVNLHHFLLDGVIWKLRQSRVGGVLLSPQRASADPGSRAALPLGRPLVAAGLVSLAVLLFGLAEEEFGLARRFEPWR